MNRLFQLEVGHVLQPVLIQNVSLKWITRYAEVSKDFNPIHLDKGAARHLGFKHPIVHGMLTMGFASRILSPYMNANTLIQQMRVTFRAPLLIGEGVELMGVIKEKSADEVNVVVKGMSSSGLQVFHGQVIVKNRK
ncbi:MAG: hypothetical protein IMZ40_01305 [Bacilli bacterium]|nr:hypothetical protein [Bacilli bacterium]